MRHPIGRKRVPAGAGQTRRRRAICYTLESASIGDRSGQSVCRLGRGKTLLGFHAKPADAPIQLLVGLEHAFSWRQIRRWRASRTQRWAMEKKNVVVVGWDESNFRRLQILERSHPYRFHKLLKLTQIRAAQPLSLENLLQQAEDELQQLTGPAGKLAGSVDAFVGYWDFPVTDLVVLLCQQRGLPSASLEALLKCEHKLWSRHEQQKVVPDLLPAYCAVDPFDEASVAAIPLEYPYWLKPVKSFASYLGFRIENRQDLTQAVEKIRSSIHFLGRTFDDVLQRVELPEEIDAVGGMHCIAESIISGHQCTLEGYVWHGEVHVYGVVDSIRISGGSSFSRYQYPSQLPPEVQQRMIEATARVLTHIGYDTAAFNVEFFYDSQHNKLWLLEINPRISQSHSTLFEKVDGASHHQVMVQLALGQQPTPPWREGEYRCAAKFFVRHRGDAYVEHVPSASEIEEIERQVPGATIELRIGADMWLSDLRHQDSYTYELAHVFIGAADEQELLEKYQTCTRNLEFRFRNAPALARDPQVEHP